MKLLKLTAAMIIFILSVIGITAILIFIACVTAPTETIPAEAIPAQGVVVEEESDRSCLWVNGSGRLITVDVQKIFS